MPATKTAKRTTDSQAKSSAPKRAKVRMTPVEKKMATVMEALMNEETVVPGTESNRSMLVAAATVALQIPKDARHADQDAVLGMLMEVFNAEKSRWEARVADATGASEKAVLERGDKMGVKDAADAELKAHWDVVSERMLAQSKASEVVEDSKEQLSAALAERAGAEAEKEKLVKTQHRDLAVQETMKGLKEGLYENPKELKKCIADVSELFQALGAEEALLKTLPQVFRRKPADRGSFDDIALQQLDSRMENHLVSLVSKIEAADATVAEKEVAATAWEAAVEVAEDKKRESDESLQASETHHEQLREALTGARKVLKEYTTAAKSQDGVVAQEQCGLYKAEEVLEALAFLQEYVVPVVEETPEPETVAAESVEAPTEMPVETPTEMPVENLVTIPTTKGKEIEVHMNFEDVPSPAKRARQSFSRDSLNMVVA